MKGDEGWRMGTETDGSGGVRGTRRVKRGADGMEKEVKRDVRGCLFWVTKW